MGSAASKVKPKSIPKVASQKPLPSAQYSRPPPAQVSEAKNDVIEQDGKDPSLIGRASSLGQVNVPNAGVAFRTDNSMLDILQTRKEQDEQADTTIPNRISARSISNLFDECKEAKTRKEIEDLAQLYGMEYNVLAELIRHVNAPSISSIPLPAKSPEEDDGETQLAKWVDPPALEQPKLNA